MPTDRLSLKVHVFPVPRGMTEDEAWAEFKVLGRFVEYRWWKPRFWFPKWAIRIEKGE